MAQSKHYSKERVLETVDGITRLKYPVGYPIPDEEARRQGLVNESEAEKAARRVSELPTGDGAVNPPGRGPGEPSDAGTLSPDGSGDPAGNTGDAAPAGDDGTATATPRKATPAKRPAAKKTAAKSTSRKRSS